MEVDLTKIRKELDLFGYQNPIDFLKDLYGKAKELRKSYNLKSYSMDLGFGENNTMAQIHGEHRNLTTKAAERISAAIKLNRAEGKYFLTLVELKLLKSQSKKEEKIDLILELRGRHGKAFADRKELEFFNDWTHAVVFELLDTITAQTPAEICQRFAMPIEEQEVVKSIELLRDIDLVSESSEKSGHFIKNQKDFSAGGSVPGMSIVRFHQEMMNLAKASLLDTPPQQRDISSVTIAIDESMISRLKDDIRLFRRYLMFLASQSEQSEKVMQVNIQLFPISK